MILAGFTTLDRLLLQEGIQTNVWIRSAEHVVGWASTWHFFLQWLASIQYFGAIGIWHLHGSKRKDFDVEHLRQCVFSCTVIICHHLSSSVIIHFLGPFLSGCLYLRRTPGLTPVGCFCALGAKLRRRDSSGEGLHLVPSCGWRPGRASPLCGLKI